MSDTERKILELAEAGRSVDGLHAPQSAAMTHALQRVGAVVVKVKADERYATLSLTALGKTMLEQHRTLSEPASEPFGGEELLREISSKLDVIHDVLSAINGAVRGR